MARRPFKFKLPTTSKESAQHRQIQKTHSEFEIPRYHMRLLTNIRADIVALTFHFVTFDSKFFESKWIRCFDTLTLVHWYFCCVFPFTISMIRDGSSLDTNRVRFGLRSEAQEVDSCNLASAGLHLLKDGRVQGVVSSNATTISCSTVFVQDPIRGIVVSMDISVPVTRFSYGRQVVFFKSWGLDDLEAAEQVREPKYKAETPSMLQDLEVDPPEGYNLLELSELSNFKLLCNPTCPWLTITSEGELSVNSTETKKPFPEDMRSQAGRNSFWNVVFPESAAEGFFLGTC